jgi:anti-sigma factor RsiW
MQSHEEHLLEWNDALQDAVDGVLTPAVRATLEVHLQSCEICQEQLAELERVDGELVTASPRLTLDDAFERRLFAKIDSSDERARAAKRRQAQREIERARQALARDWRRNLVIVVPSIIAGIVLAYFLSTYFGSSEFMRALIAEGTAGLGHDAAGIVRIAVTSVIGAGIGLTIARWLARPN